MRNRVAHTFVVAALLVGCSDSHGLVEDDGGAARIDASGLDAGMPVDAGSPRDAGPRSACGADDARAEVCPEAICDGLPLWYWSGDECFEIDCGACTGADCGRGVTSEAACLAAHASCEPALCRATDGEWRWWGEHCGHFVCGREPPVDCIVGMPACDCGPFRSFDPERGCFDDATCPVPEPVTDEHLCTVTGGTWSNICCHTECGRYCDLDCAAPACDCGPGRIFEVRGCVDRARCHEPLAGETCEGEARCQNGTVCCEQCGGAGCVGPATCKAPVCDADPTIDTCGNNLLAP